DYLKMHLQKIETDIPLPFTGGAIGYVAYDAIRQFYDIGTNLDDELQMPDFHFMLYHTIVAYEHRTETAHIVTINIDEVSEIELDKRIQTITTALDEQMLIPDPEAFSIQFKPQISKEVFMDNVQKAQQYINNGEAAQIVLS